MRRRLGVDFRFFSAKKECGSKSESFGTPTVFQEFRLILCAVFVRSVSAISP